MLPISTRRERRGPKLLSALEGYSFQTLAADVGAGTTVALVALPLALAFAIASGLPPESGLYCAIVTGVLIAALGGSRVQIGGPAGAFLILASGLVAAHGLPALLVCTAMAGVLLVTLGATGMGTAIKFMPRAIVLGFTNGISVLIASTQIPEILGLRVDRLPPDLPGRVAAAASSLGTTSLPALLLGAACLALLIYATRRPPRMPAAVATLLGGTVLVSIFDIPVDTIASRFPGPPTAVFDLSWTAAAWGAFDWRLTLTLLTPAFTIALLGAIESLRSAVAADRLSGDRHDPNVELIAQGVANLASPFVGGLPAAGAMTSTVENVRAGARTPIAGIAHALVLAAIAWLAAPAVGAIPMPVLAAIVLMTAWRMGDWSGLPDAIRPSRAHAGAWLVTLALTVFADLTQAVAVGMTLAALLFIRTVASTTSVAQVTEDGPRETDVPGYVTVFRITGPFLFGATDRLQGIADRLDALPPIVILRLRDMTATDATGLHAIEDLCDAVRRSGRAFLLAGAQAQPAALMARGRFLRHVGAENVCATDADALGRARELHETRFQPGFPRGA